MQRFELMDDLLREIGEGRPLPGYLEGFPLRASEMVQIGRGPMNLRSLEIWGRTSFVLDIRSEPQTSWTVLADPDWLGFLLPLWWEGDYLFNKTAASPGNVFMIDPHAEYVGVYGKRRALVFGVKRLSFELAWSSLRGVPFESLPSGHRLLPTSPVQALPLVRLFKKIRMSAMDLGQQDGRYLLPLSRETDLVTGLADWFLSMDGSSSARAIGISRSLKIVASAVEHLRVARLDQVSLPSLCAAAGVSKSLLHQAFVDVHGVSPGDFLIRQRLSTARELLSRRDSGATSVKDAAIEVGFLSSGRFAKMYARNFDELPSTTLERRALTDASWKYTVRPAGRTDTDLPQ